MIRVAFDTDNLNDLDPNFPILLTYSDLVGDLSQLEELRNRFIQSELVLIDRGLGDPTGQATVIDIETGAYSVASLPAWVDRKRGEGLRYLTGYCDRNNLAGVLAIERNRIWHWVATLDGTCQIAGFKAMRAPAAVQILGEDQVGLHGDLTLVLEESWHPEA